MNELAGKISWPHILTRVMAYLEEEGRKRVAASCRGRNENRASRKTARYAGLKCSREAH